MGKRKIKLSGEVSFRPSISLNGASETGMQVEEFYNKAIKNINVVKI